MNFFRYQLIQIREGGLTTLRRKLLALLRLLKDSLLFASNAIWAIPAVFLIRVMRPMVHVRLGVLMSSRIGHFVADASIFLARQSIKAVGQRTVDWFWFKEPTCNEQWSRMVRRQLFVRWWVRYLAGFNKLIPGGASHDYSLPALTGSRIVYGPLRQSTARLEFSSQENEVAKSFLLSRGWKEGEEWICLQVRDSAYLDKHPLHAGGGSKAWNYHDYRDSDIDTYVKAMHFLLEKGYWIIRMGKTVHKRFPLEHERIIDFPFVEDQDDLLDIWLSRNCKYFVSTATGIDIIPWVYERPIVFVNALPLIGGAFPIKHIWVPKHLRWKDSGNYLSLKEHIHHGYFTANEYQDSGILIEDLSPDEIANAVMECEQRLAGTWIETSEDSVRQQRFWHEIRKSPEFRKNNDYVHPEARMGCSWLRSMGEAFFA